MVDATPSCVCGAYAEFAETPENCLRGVKWSPDGLCLLTAAEDKHLRLFELPAELLEADADDAACGAKAAETELRSVLQVREGDAIYDYGWYPFMDSAEPATCCFASSSRDNPIHLWDAYSGENRASYIPFNHLDEVVAAHSIAFSPTGQRLYAGFERAIRIFDVARPGRQCELRPTCKTRKSRDGLRGIISCFAFAPDAPELFAAGSFSGTVGLYTENSKQLITELKGHTGGVTQCAFSPDGLRLYTAARRDSAIHSWDVRMSGAILASFHRACPTNQRIGFELRHSSLLTASQDGRVLVYDTNAPHEPPTTLLTFGEATNAATIHPHEPLLAVAAGERCYPQPRSDGEELGEEPPDSDDDGDGGGGGSRNGLSVWRMPAPPAVGGGAEVAFG